MAVLWANEDGTRTAVMAGDSVVIIGVSSPVGPCATATHLFSTQEFDELVAAYIHERAIDDEAAC